MMRNSRTHAIEAALDLIETFNIGQGEVTFKFDDGDVIRARFCYVSKQEWEEIERKARRGIIGTLYDWWKSRSSNVE